MNLKIILLLFMAFLILISCSEINTTTDVPVQTFNYYDNLRLEHQVVQSLVSLNHNNHIADSLHISFFSLNEMLLGRNSNSLYFDCLHNYHHGYPDSCDYDYSVFDKGSCNIDTRNLDRMNVNYYVIDSDSSLAEFKRLFASKRQFVNSKTDYINFLFNEFNEIKLQQRQLITIATIEVQAKQILNLTNTYKPEYIAMVNNPDTAIANIAQRKYGDCYATESIIGGSGYDLRTYYVPVSSPYTVSQVRRALLDHVKSYFNTNSLQTESDSTKNILKTVSPTTPICVSATPGGAASAYFSTLSINPEIIKNFIEAMTNPAKTGTISYRFAEYNPPTE